MRKANVAKVLPEFVRLDLAAGGQWNIGSTGVLAGE
jgi:hypothetical protein